MAEKITLHGPQIIKKKSLDKTTAAQRNSKEFIPDEYKTIAKSMERQFAQHMIKQMEKTTGKSDNSTAGSYYKSLMEGKRADSLTVNNGGMGIQDVILDQIYPKKMRTKFALDYYNRQKDSKRVFKRNEVEMHSVPTEQKLHQITKSNAKDESISLHKKESSNE